MSHTPGVLVLVPRFQLVPSPPLPCTKGGQGLYHLLVIAELLARCIAKYVLDVLCTYNDLPHRGVRTKTMGLHVSFSFLG